MGSVFGKIDVAEQAAYKTIKTFANFEIRLYAESVAVETPCGTSLSSPEHNIAFRRLAAYIGVIGTPQNTKNSENAPEQIAMTAPVLTSTPAKNNSEQIAMTAPVLTSAPSRNNSEQIAMTAPVLTSKSDKQMMSFILPSKYTIDNAPLPLDPEVTLRRIPERYCAVVRFSGICYDETAKQKAAFVLNELKNNSIEPTSETKERLESGEQYWELARYNPPWAIPFLRTNDVMIPVEYEL